MIAHLAGALGVRTWVLADLNPPGRPKNDAIHGNGKSDTHMSDNSFKPTITKDVR